MKKLTASKLINKEIDKIIILKIMNESRTYKSDRDKTLPFTYRECEKAVELGIIQGKLQTQEDFIKMIDELEYDENSNLFYVLEKLKSKSKGEQDV